MVIDLEAFLRRQSAAPNPQVIQFPQMHGMLRQRHIKTQAIGWIIPLNRRLLFSPGEHVLGPVGQQRLTDRQWLLGSDLYRAEEDTIQRLHAAAARQRV